MKPCKCVTVHRPAITRTLPWFTHEDHKPRHTVWICPATHDAVTQLVDLYIEHDGKPPWSKRRAFPEYARHLAEKTWQIRQ